MNKNVDNNTIKKIISECSVYPKPTKSEAKEEYIRVSNIIYNINNSASEERIIKNVSKSLDIDNMINNEKWIRYDE